MKYTSALIIGVFFLALISIGSCKKDSSELSDDEKFCSLVNEQKFDSTGYLVDQYLATLVNQNSDTSLASLAKWLEGKSCVDSSSVLCNSCIETLPPQSELSVKFVTNGQSVSLIMDIIMENPMKFRTFHN